MSAQRLNRALVLEERSELSDGAGGVVSTWQTLGTLWADIRGLSGGDAGALGVARSEVRLKITLRASPHGTPMRPRPDQRFREETRVYRIHAVAEAEPLGRFVTCYASEEVAT